MNLAQAMTAKTAFANMKKKLEKSGIDVSDVRYITDLPPVLASILPEDLAKQAEALLENQEMVTALLTAFTGAADLGALVNSLYRPTDKVKESDLNG